MKKFWNYKLWWRVPCTILMLVGVFCICVILYSSITHIQDSEWSSVVIERYNPFRKKHLINAQTRKIIIRNIDWAVNIGDNDSLLLFEKDHKRGFVNLHTGDITIPAQYDYAWVFSNGLAAVCLNGKLGFIRPDGAIAIPMKFRRGNQSDRPSFQNGHCIVTDSTSHLGVIDTLGNWVTPPIYDEIILCQDYFVAKKTGNFNKQIAYDGHIIYEYGIDCIYDLAYDINIYDEDEGCEIERPIINHEFFKYKVYQRMGLMDKKGNFITPPVYTELYGLTPTLFRAILQDEHSEVLINTKGEIVSK